MNILLGVTGSVATIVTDRLFAALKGFGEIKILATEHSYHFLTGNMKQCVVADAVEWEWRKIGDRVCHIELRKWADIFVVAPCSANTLGKIANGLCDNLLTNVARCWNWKEGKWMVIVPAMNTAMWDHPATHEHLNKVTSWGARIIPPVKKTLACGDTGVGAMADVETISQMVEICAKLRMVGLDKNMTVESRANGS